MQRITFEIEQNSDIELLLLLAQRIGIKIIPHIPPITDQEERQKHLSIIAKGADMANFGDPVEWQREQRTDRVLPYRD